MIYIDTMSSRVNWNSGVFLGINPVPCGKYSNCDFVNFFWHNLDVYGFGKHALTILPDPST
jgi:hypothetical protein